MVILKKLKGSTLMETLVATVLIVIIFMIASLILNNLFANRMKFDNQSIQTELNRFEYRLINEKQNLSIDYTYDFDKWQLTMSKFSKDSTIVLEVRATNENNRIINRNIVP